MSGRRARGEGCVYWNKTHGHWEGRVVVGTKIATRGKRKGEEIEDARYARCRIPGRAGERQVEQMLRDIVSGVEAERAATRTGGYTMWEAIEDWHAWVTTQPKTSQVTADKYLGQLRKWVRPRLGDRLLRDCDAAVISDMLEEIAPFLGRDSLGDILNSMRRAINYARRRRKIDRNDAEAVELPEAGVKPRDWDFLDQETVEKILSQTEGTPMHALMMTGFYLGLRPGEIRALQWDDIDFSRGVLYVVRYLKNRTSRRGIRLPQRLLAALRSHRQEYASGSHVFTREDGSPLDRDALRWRTGKVFRAAGLDLADPYVMRHTFASIMDHQGVEHRKIADMMGHKDVTTFQRVYRHRLSPEVTETAELLDGIWGSAS